MLKKISYLVFPLLVVIVALFIMAGFQPFYSYQFEKNGVYQVVDIDRAAMPTVIDRLSGYVVGRYPTFNYQLTIGGVRCDVYNAREVLHMADVRKTFDVTRYIGAFIAIYVTAVIFALAAEQRLDYLVKLTRAGLIGVVIATLLLGVLVASNFAKYFVVFHEIFFDNDLWLLNPATDRLIQMLPQVFFRDIVLAIIGLAIGLAALSHLVALSISRRRGAKGND